MLLWFIAKNVGIVFGYMYPAYQTFKALDGKDKEARLQLLRYWAVFAAFAAVEFYADMLISWLPFYYEVKVLFLLYLSIPFTKGSSTVYEMHMKPWLRAHQVEIDEAIEQLRASLLACVSAYRDRVVMWIHQSTIEFCTAKLPAALPLYMMLTALISETFKHLFGAPSNSSDAQIDNTIASDITTATSDEKVMEINVSGMTKTTVEDKATEMAKIPATSTAAKLSITSDHIKANVAASTPVMAMPHPTLAQYGSSIHSRTTSHVLPSTSMSSASRSHRRDASAPVSAVEPKTRATKKAQQQMQGTAMPTRSSARPTPQLIKKDPVVAAVVEEDSILCSSPSKRSSNPKILASSPHRRSAV